MAQASKLLAILGAAALAAAQNSTTKVSVPANISTQPLVKDVYGYSLEPVWVDAYTASDIASNLMSIIGDLTGKPPPFRVGGNTADQTYLHSEQRERSLAFPNETNTEWFNITSSWYDTWADYFPEGTDLIYTLNFADRQDAWENAVAQAEAVYNALGSKLTMLELGNEIDHFINKDWRPEGWGVDEYVPEWFNLTEQIVASDWYESAENPPKFQAGVFADPPWVPDQQDQLDDFDIINATEAGLVDDDLISAYSVHLYPQSTCDPERWHRMRLDLLSNHTVLWLNVSQYVPQVAAAREAGKPLVMGETNSISCSGRSGISDTFGAALWGVDYVLMAASIGFEKVYFHLGAHSEYSSFTPLSYEYKGENLTAGVRAGFYGHYFIANAVAGNDNYSIAALPGANASDFSGYGIYGSSNSLQKLVFLDMAVWNTTEGRSNPSTISATDATSRSNGTRPIRHVEVNVPWAEGSSVNVLRLSGPGTNAKSDVSVSGTTFDMDSGDREGDEEEETLTVRARGLLTFDIPSAGGILLQLADSESGDGSGDDSGNGSDDPDNGDDGSDDDPQSVAASQGKPYTMRCALLVGFFLML
ncbi:putative glycoside hydrolase family 79 protein [Paramyrothecium foliicola]|nr:putative glycoside hydrolase family 79 protein [Paramyrothecium foliicola]